ncbi:MAG: energy transducer TonB [Ginsengibacter sp.]
MEANQILQSDILDILFDGKNKLYGAYQLRKNYNQRISKALLSMIGFILLFIAGSIIEKKFRKNETFVQQISHGIILKNMAVDKPKPLPKLPTPPVRKATLQVTRPTIIKDKLVTETPPDVKQIEAAIIGVKTIDGPKPGLGIVNPPTEIIGSNVIAKPVNKNSDDKKRFMPIEIEATFPGGSGAWQKFIRRAIESELGEFSESDYGTCMVKFIVDTNGNVSNVEATTTKSSRLAEIAVQAIKKGPKWVPAMQNGHYVTATRYQPITLNNPDQ